MFNNGFANNVYLSYFVAVDGWHTFGDWYGDGRDIFCLVERGVLKINEFSVIPVLYEIEMHCNSNYGCMTIEFYRLVTFLHWIRIESGLCCNIPQII